MAKRYVQGDGQISFPDYPWLAPIDVQKLATLPALDATGKGVLLVDVREQVCVLAGGIDSETGQPLTVVDENGNPLTLSVTIRVESGPRNKGQATMIQRKAEQQATGKTLRETKDANARKEHATAITKAAVDAAVQTAASTRSKLAESLEATVSANLFKAFGGLAITDGK